MLKRSRRSARLADRWNRFSAHFRVEILLAGFTYLAVLTISLAVGALWLRDDTVPSVRILGSGARLSLLIVSENSRLLIASGDDGSAFGNSLARARHPTNRRLDVVILAGNEKDVTVAKRARSDLGAKAVFLIDGPLTAHLDDLGLRRDELITRPLELELPGGINVTIAPESSRNGGWSALIQRGTTRIFAGNDSDAIEGSGAFSAMILSEGSESDLQFAPSGSAVIVPSRSLTARELRDAITERGKSLYVLRIEPASAATLTFVDDGLRLPDSAIQYGESP